MFVEHLRNDSIYLMITRTAFSCRCNWVLMRRRIYLLTTSFLRRSCPVTYFRHYARMSFT